MSPWRSWVGPMRAIPPRAKSSGGEAASACAGRLAWGADFSSIVAPIPNIAAASSAAAAIFNLFTNIARKAPRASATAWAETQLTAAPFSPVNQRAARTVLSSNGSGTAAGAQSAASTPATPAEGRTNPRRARHSRSRSRARSSRAAIDPRGQPRISAAWSLVLPSR